MGIGMGLEMMRERRGEGEEEREVLGEEWREKMEEVEALRVRVRRSKADLKELGRWSMLGRWKCILELVGWCEVAIKWCSG